LPGWSDRLLVAQVRGSLTNSVQETVVVEREGNSACGGGHQEASKLERAIVVILSRLSPKPLETRWCWDKTVGESQCAKQVQLPAADVLLLLKSDEQFVGQAELRGGSDGMAGSGFLVAPGQSPS
jgi:hypothetical protein